MKRNFFTPFLLFIVAVISLCKADAGQQVRTFRPLEIKQVAIASGSNAVAVTKRGSEVERALSEAWKHFDARQWAAAREGFLFVLGQVPRNRLAAEGLRFSQFYNCSVCGTTRASLMTGLYHHQVGVRTWNGIRNDPSILPTKQRCRPAQRIASRIEGS